MHSTKTGRRGFVTRLTTAVSATLVAPSLLAESVNLYPARPLRPVAEPPATPVVNEWIMAHPSIRKVIVWFTPTQVQYYQTWSAAQRDALQQAFEKAWNNQPSGLYRVPTSLSPDLPDEFPAAVLPPAEAWAFYLAQLAQSLALEIGNRLKWSLLNYSTGDAAILLDSRETFLYDQYLKGYRVWADKNGFYTPAPPDLILSFLNSIQFLEQMPPSTLPDPEKKPIPGVIHLPNFTWQRNAIVRLFDWCRNNLHHFAGGYTTAAMKEHWQTHGFPPIALVIEGTIKAGYPKMHWTAGCSGTVGFLTGVLRAVNIPVRNLWIGGHSVPYFTSERAYLSHGDDLYGYYSHGKKSGDPLPYPSAKLLLNQTRFNELFGPDVSPPDKNIGRRSRELAMLYLPIGLIFKYCADKAANASHAGGEVFKSLGSTYPLAELEQAKLWERLEARLTQLGGCAANAPTF